MKRSLERLAAALSAAAAVIHAAEAPDHFTEWWGYGTFFVVAAAAQAALAIILLLAPWRQGPGRWPWRRRGFVLAVGIAGNLAIIALYLLTRTIGVPLVGPEAGEVEEVTRSGAVATALELLLTIVLVGLIRARGAVSLSDGLRNRPLPTDEAAARAPDASLVMVSLAAVLILLTLATIDAIPAVIAQQEGGTGPGSALLLGIAIQSACVVVGAAVTMALFRRAGESVLVASALGLAAAVGGIPLGEHGSLAWIIVVHALAGLSLGSVLTVTIVRAASTPPHIRSPAIALMLIAWLGARLVVGVPERGGLVALMLMPLAALVLSWWIAARPTGAAPDQPGVGRQRGGPLFALMVVMAIGLIAALAGSDASGVVATLLGRPIGLASMEALATWRPILLATGLGLIVAGGAIAARLAALDRASIAAVAGLALVTTSTSGAAVLLAVSLPVSTIVPGERTITAVGLAGVAGIIAGLVLPAIIMTIRYWRWPAELLGALVLVAAAGLVVLSVGGSSPGNADAAQVTSLSGVVGIGTGWALIALWRNLADRRRDGHVAAIALGVIATTVGLALGTSLARGEAIRLITAEARQGAPIGTLFAAAAGGALLLLGAIQWWRHGPTASERG